MSDQWGNAIYLGILLCFLIYSLANNQRLKSKDIIKYSLYWIAIALIFIIIYSYKTEFGDFTSKVSSQIHPSNAKRLKNGDIIINASVDGHFYMILEVNGKNIRAMIDTGATDLTLNINDAKKIGIDFSKLMFNKTYRTANGSSYGASINIKSIKIADLEFRNVKAAVNQGEMSGSLIGINFLKKFKKYQFKKDKLILTP